MWNCPKCNSSDLDVSVEVWARLLQDEDSDNFSTDTDDSQNGSDHEWGVNSIMQCRECQYTAISEEFEQGDILRDKQLEIPRPLHVEFER